MPLGIGICPKRKSLFVLFRHRCLSDGTVTCRKEPGGPRGLQANPLLFSLLYVAASLWLSAAMKAGRKVPEPIVEKQFKGRFPLRLPGDLRRKLELEATRKGVSLNQFLLQKIA